MSQMIPQATIDALRNFANVSIDNYGIDCQLYLLTNPNLIASHDAYSEIEEKTFTLYDTKVWIDWSPNMAHLRKLGLFAEDEPIPIVARFKHQPEISSVNDNMPEIIIGSYIKVNIQYVPKQYDTDEFEIVNIFVGPLHDMQVVKQYSLAPRRVK